VAWGGAQRKRLADAQAALEAAFSSLAQ